MYSTSTSMPKLGHQYYLKTLTKKALIPSSISRIWKCGYWAANPIYPKFDVVSANKAITSSCQAGDIEHARKLFDTMLQRSIVSWNIMITGYSKWNMISEALELISLVHFSDARFNETTFATSLSVCGRAPSLVCGKQIHGLVLKYGHLRYKLVGSALLYVYATCHIEDGRRVFDELNRENELVWSLMVVGYVERNLMDEAQCIFRRMPSRGVVAWTSLISGYVKNGYDFEKALELFKMMRNSGEAIPNEFTLDCVVRACGRLGDSRSGRAVHGLIIRSGFGNECGICCGLVSFYCNCEFMDDATKIHDEIPDQSVNDSNQMIKAYAMCGRVKDSERLFLQMPDWNLTSMNTMISVYARNDEISKALELFEKAKGEGCPVTWNSMMSGYIQNHQHENALELYLNMHRLSICKTISTFSVLFHACACLGSFQQGKLLHTHVAKTPFSSDVCVCTALVDMYSKCGCFPDAREAFSSISSPNVASWTAMINGCAHHGFGSDAIALFNLMLERGTSPNAATFVAVLSACAHAGLVDIGMKLFHSMRELYGVIPTVEHLTCAVDLLGRAGLVHEAEKLIQDMPIEADKVLLISLLNASWFSMDMNVSERLAERMFSVDSQSTPASVIMSNMYSTLGNWWQKLKVRDTLKETGVKKDPGCSWIDVNNGTHEFSAQHRSHSNSDLIHAALKSLQVNANYFTQLDLYSLNNYQGGKREKDHTLPVRSL